MATMTSNNGTTVMMPRPSSSLDGFIMRRLRGNAAARWSVSEASLKSNTTALTDDMSVSTMGSQLTTCRENGKRRMSVSFREEPDDVLMIPTIYEYSQEERDTLFYNEDDQEDLMEDAELSAVGWMSGDNDTNRGLERFTHEGRQHSKQRKQQVIAAVLEEQRRLTEESFVRGVDQQKVLAKVSRRLSEACQEMAYERAYQDELASLPRQKEPEKPKPKPGLLSRMSSILDRAAIAMPRS